MNGQAQYGVRMYTIANRIVKSSTPNLRTIPSRTYIRKHTNMRAAAVVIVMQAMNPGARLLLSFCEDVGIAEEAMIYTWFEKCQKL